MSEPLTPKYCCVVCGAQFDWGHGTWANGRYVREWAQMVCRYCDHEDGIAPLRNVLANLAERGIKPIYNFRGYVIVPQ